MGRPAEGAGARARAEAEAEAAAAEGHVFPECRKAFRASFSCYLDADEGPARGEAECGDVIASFSNCVAAQVALALQNHP